MAGGVQRACLVVSQLGRPDDGTDVNGFDTAELFVDLIPRDDWKTAKTRDREQSGASVGR